MNKSDTILAIKRDRRSRRDEEIALHGHPISFVRVVRNKKKYTRKEKHKKQS